MLEKLLQDFRKLRYYCPRPWPSLWQKTVFRRMEMKHMNYSDVEEKIYFL